VRRSIRLAAPCRCVPVNSDVRPQMGFFSNMFGSKQPESPPPEEPLVPVPIPALGVMLLHLEKAKGSPLIEPEVIAARDKAVCMMMRLSHRTALEEKRGYRDIDPENVWAEWLAFRQEVRGDEV
jgi:hypothetical protein